MIAECDKSARAVEAALEKVEAGGSIEVVLDVVLNELTILQVNGSLFFAGRAGWRRRSDFVPWPEAAVQRLKR